MNSNTNSRQSTNTRIYYFDAIKTLANDKEAFRASLRKEK